MEPKKILFIDLDVKRAEMRFMPELVPFVGGVTMGVKLYAIYKERDPVVISIGPLNGFFPFASKTCFVTEHSGVIEDLYVGGSVSFRLKYSGVDGIVLAGRASEDLHLDIVDDSVTFLNPQVDFGSLGLPGKRSILHFDKGLMRLDGYFNAESGILEQKLVAKKVAGLSITGTKTFKLTEEAKYTALFKELLDQRDMVDAEAVGNPSCSGCPLGCNKSQVGEMGGNILVHSLVACGYAEDIYSNMGTVFACLDCLGYKYTHEQLEALPDLFTKTLKEIT